MIYMNQTRFINWLEELKFAPKRNGVIDGIKWVMLEKKTQPYGSEKNFYWYRFKLSISNRNYWFSRWSFNDNPERVAKHLIKEFQKK